MILEYFSLQLLFWCRRRIALSVTIMVYCPQIGAATAEPAQALRAHNRWSDGRRATDRTVSTFGCAEPTRPGVVRRRRRLPSLRSTLPNSFTSRAALGLSKWPARVPYPPSRPRLVGVARRHRRSGGGDSPSRTYTRVYCILRLFYFFYMPAKPPESPPPPHRCSPPRKLVAFHLHTRRLLLLYFLRFASLSVWPIYVTTTRSRRIYYIIYMYIHNNI